MRKVMRRAKRNGSSLICFWSFAVALGLCVAGSVAGSPPVDGASDIHRIDFRNFRYYPNCLNWETPGKVAVKTINGSYSKKDRNGKVTFEVTSIAYGDLNGDGMDEAVVVTNCNTGGTGWFDAGWLYVMRNGKPVMISHIQGGDRANGGIRAVRIESGLLMVERLGSDLSGRALGADFIETTTYRLSGSELSQVGEPVHRDFRGEGQAKRIQFERGNSSAVLMGTTSDADYYVLHALEKQTLTVRVFSTLNNARFELIVDDATMAYRATEWSGQLPARGDYHIVVVSNNGSTNYKLEVAVR